MLFDARIVAVHKPEQALKMVIDKITLKRIRVNQSTVGKIDVPRMAKLLDTWISAAMPSIDAFLDERKLVVPKTVLGMFSLDNLTMAIRDNYMDLGFTPEFRVHYELVDERILPFRAIKNEPYYPNPREGGFSTFFLEQLGEAGQYLQSRRPNFQWQDIIWDQLRIFLNSAGGLIGFIFGF